MELDFTKLDSLAYVEGKRESFTYQSPFNGEAIKSASQPAEKNGSEPFTYFTMYEAAYGYHRRYSPPQNIPEYWEKAVADLSSLSRRFGNNAFIIALLSAIYAELEREYKGL